MVGEERVEERRGRLGVEEEEKRGFSLLLPTWIERIHQKSGFFFGRRWKGGRRRGRREGKERGGKGGGKGREWLI